MRLGIGSDHQGFLLKREILNYYKGKETELVDYGTNSEEPVDYPDYAKKVGDAVVRGEVDLGVLICGSGVGVCIVANKIKGIRCARVINEQETYFARLHNDANIMSIAKTTNLKNAILMIDSFKNTKFSEEERHKRRIEKIKQIENES